MCIRDSDYATQIRGSENLGPMQYSEAEQAAMAAVSYTQLCRGKLLCTVFPAHF